MPRDLPPEIWKFVFSYLTAQMSLCHHSDLSTEELWKTRTFPDPHRDRNFPTTTQFMDRAIPCRLWKPEFKPSAEALSVVQVCRMWHDLGVEFLYHTVVFSTTAHFNILKVVLAPSYGRGHFVRRVRVSRSVRVSPDELRLVLGDCPRIEDFESGMYPSARLFSTLASRSSIQHFFFTGQDTSHLIGFSPIRLSFFINLQTLHIVAMPSLAHIPAVLPHLAVLVLKCNDNSARYHQYVAEWTLPSLRVLVCQWITTPILHLLCKAFALTIELLEVIQYDSWNIIPDTIEMPMLKHLVIDWIPPFPHYTPRFSASYHFHSLPSLTTIRLENLDQALKSSSAALVAAEIEPDLAMLSPENPFAPRLRTFYVGAELGDVAGEDLERRFAARAVFGWVLRGRDGVWKVAGDGELVLAEPVSA